MLGHSIGSSNTLQLKNPWLECTQALFEPTRVARNGLGNLERNRGEHGKRPANCSLADVEVEIVRSLSKLMRRDARAGAETHGAQPEQRAQVGLA